jgi:hypothetical protein
MIHFYRSKPFHAKSATPKTPLEPAVNGKREPNAISDGIAIAKFTAAHMKL